MGRRISPETILQTLPRTLPQTLPQPLPQRLLPQGWGAPPLPGTHEMVPPTRIVEVIRYCLLGGLLLRRPPHGLMLELGQFVRGGLDCGGFPGYEDGLPVGLDGFPTGLLVVLGWFGMISPDALVFARARLATG